VKIEDPKFDLKLRDYLHNYMSLKKIGELKGQLSLLFIMLMCPVRIVGIIHWDEDDREIIFPKLRNVDTDEDHFRW
jgi:hypothetical protein